MVPRRNLLVSLTALLSAGCVTRRPASDTTGGSPEPTRGPTRTPTSTPASTATPALDCLDVTTVDPPTASSDEVTPPPYPALPDSFDVDTAGSFVAEYETSYVLNSLVMNNPGATYVDVAVSDTPPVTETERGYVVDLDYTYAVEAETPADFPPRHVAYLVRDGVVARAELDPDEASVPFPVTGATVFSCEP